MKTKRSTFRRSVYTHLLSNYQLCAHDLIIHVLMLDENQSTMDRGNDASQLQLILIKSKCGKSCALDSAVRTHKNMHGYNNSNCMVIAPTRKAAPNACRLTVHSYKKGLSLSLSVKGSFKGLLGKRLICLQRKHKDNLKLIVLDEFTMIS